MSSLNFPLLLCWESSEWTGCGYFLKHAQLMINRDSCGLVLPHHLPIPYTVLEYTATLRQYTQYTVYIKAENEKQEWRWWIYLRLLNLKIAVSLVEEVRGKQDTLCLLLLLLLLRSFSWLPHALLGEILTNVNLCSVSVNNSVSQTFTKTRFWLPNGLHFPLHIIAHHQCPLSAPLTAQNFPRLTSDFQEREKRE